MPATSSPQSGQSSESTQPFDPAMLDILACPACMANLRLEALQLACTNCTRTYPIINGVPVLIADRAANQT